MKKTLVIALILLLAATSSFVVSCQSNKEATTPRLGNGRIAFVSTRNGKFAIYVIDADGKNQKRITSTNANDFSPSWSPDGAKIAFTSWPFAGSSSSAIYIMNADGSNQTKISKGWNAANPAWSPDGTKIAFMGNGEAENVICVMNSDGSNPIVLTELGNYGVPAWSPDSTKIAFSSLTMMAFGGEEIYVMDADGNNQKRLTNNNYVDVFPAWSPDGTKIAFTSYYRPDSDALPTIYIMNTDGSNQTKLASDGSLPAWSPDGTRIAFVSARDGNSEIYVMNADGSNQKRLTDNRFDDSTPVWEPMSQSNKR